MSERRFDAVGALFDRVRRGGFTQLARRYFYAASGSFSAAGRYVVRFKGAAQASDERTATIERLERTLADEREKAAALQRAADSLRFQTEVLERGYTKQLEEARRRAEEAERSLAERNAELVDLAAKYEAATESLAGTRGELQRVTAQRDRLRRQIDGDAEPDDTEDADADIPEGTINRLMAAASRPRVRRRSEGESSPGDSEAGSAEMLAPELLLSKKSADDS